MILVFFPSFFCFSFCSLGAVFFVVCGFESRSVFGCF